MMNRAAQATTQIRKGEGDRTVIFPLSSETPYLRSRGYEILVHTDDSVDLSFLNSGSAPLLDSHDRWTGLKAQIGVIIRAWLEDNRIYVEAKFSEKPEADTVYRDVLAGIVSNVSVGYDVMEIQPDDVNNRYFVTKWKPMEASFVPIPADATVGVGRSATLMEGRMTTETKPKLPAAEMPTDLASRGVEIADASREIHALAAVHNKRDLAIEFVDAAVRAGKIPSLAEFRGTIRKELPEDVPLVNRDIGLTKKERDSFRLIRLAAAMEGSVPNAVRAAAFEMEACEAAAKTAEGETRGYRLPTDIMDNWDLRAAISAGGTPNVQSVDHLSGRFIDSLRNASTVLQMGVTTLSGLEGNIEIPGGDTNTQAAWLAAEDAPAAESNPTFRKVSMSVKDVAAYTDITRRMMQQATIDIEMYARNQLMRSLADAIDLAGLSGSGAAGVPRGLKNTVGIGSVVFVGANPTWGEIVDLETDVAVANALMGNTGYLGSVSMRGYFKQTLKSAGVSGYIMSSNDDGLNGYRYGASNAVDAADLYFGNWSDLLMGLWGSMDLDRDTAAKFLSGGIRLRGIQSVDFAVARVGSFSLGN